MRCPSSIPAPLERPALSAMPAVFRAAGVAEMVPFTTGDKHKKTKRVFPIVPANRLRDGQKGEGGWSMEDDVGMGGESPLPGVDDEEVPDSPLPCASPNGETGAGAEVMEAHGKPQEEGLAGGGVGDGADQPAASDAPPDADVTALGKRRDGAAAASPAGGPDESQKRSRLGDVMPGPPGYEDMVQTAADGTKGGSEEHARAREREKRQESHAGLRAKGLAARTQLLLCSACGSLRRRSAETNTCSKRTSGGWSARRRSAAKRARSRLLRLPVQTTSR